MAETESHSVRNGVMVTVVGGLILSAILYTIPYLRSLSLRFLLWVRSGFLWVWNAVTSSYSAPGWLLLLVGLLALLGVMRVLVALRPENEPTFKKYTEDMIYGAKWRWCWAGGRVSNLWCYCPTCDATLVYDDSSCRSYSSRVSKTDFICERCNNRVVTSINGGDKSYAVGAAERELHRRMRTNEHLSCISEQ